MKVLRWRIDARDPAGRPRTVVRRGATAEMAFGPLVDAGWQPVRVEPAGSMLPDAFRRPPGPDRVAAWFGALRTVVDSGMPLSSGLALLGRQFGDPRLRELSDRLARTVSEGIGLSSALGNTASWLPVSATMLMRCGEQSGRLPESLAEVQRQLERAAATRRRIVAAAAYPIATLVLSGVVVGVLVPWILPTFEKIYKDLRAPLPPTTLALLAGWHALADRWPWIVLGLLGSTGGLIRGIRTPTGRRCFETVQRRIPGWGPWLRDVALADALGSLAGMLETGMPLVDALLAVGKSSAHPQVGDAMLTTARTVSEGGSLSQSWEALGVFPPLWCGMAAVGEASGTLPDVLRRGAAWMDQSVDDRLRKAMSVLEPTMILGVGAVVGGLLVALYHPIFTLPENLMRAR